MCVYFSVKFIYFLQCIWKTWIAKKNQFFFFARCFPLLVQMLFYFFFLTNIFSSLFLWTSFLRSPLFFLLKKTKKKLERKKKGYNKLPLTILFLTFSCPNFTIYIYIFIYVLSSSSSFDQLLSFLNRTPISLSSFLPFLFLFFFFGGEGKKER